METLAMQEPGTIVDGLVSACDDLAWRLNAAANAVGGRVGGTLRALAVQTEEQSLELMSVRIPFMSRRFEAMYERAAAQPAGAELGDCLEAQARLIESYHVASSTELPPSWAVVVARHLDEILAARHTLRNLAQQGWRTAELVGHSR